MSRHDRDGDDSYVEFQLDGKQILIVLAGILILCVISFYFGRRVGRAEAAGDGGKAPALAEALAGSEALEAENAGDDLTFFDTVEESPAAASPPPVASGAPAPATTPETGSSAPARTRTVETPATSPPPASPGPGPAAEPRPPTSPGGVEIQVAVLSERASAEALASRLRGKGYQTRVMTTRSEGKILYRVRVGGYADRTAAEAAAARLEREEKLKTWIPPQGG
jgi:cell division septation protein DedD